MKFLALSALASAANAIDGLDCGETQLACKIEAYSCKRAGQDKALYFALEKEYKEELSRSPREQIELSASPFGPMLYKRSRETLIELISVLNASFPDYDFSSVRETQFVKEELNNALTQINTRLGSKVPRYANLRDQLWATIDKEMNLRECNIYSFTPDIDCNPFEEEGDCVWSFNYFFVEKKNVKRILLFTCREAFKTDYISDDTAEADYMRMSSGGDRMEFTMDMMMEDY